MEKLQLYLSIISIFIFNLPASSSSSFSSEIAKDDKGNHNLGGIKTMFVFGDSYVDTGNWDKSSGSWHPPYGSTFPGKPTGRFSDGLVLTDYIASFLGITSPQPYEWRNSVNKSSLRGGMNFAYGGTGVFNTMVNKPNMTTQIDLFQKLLEENVYTEEELGSSMALVSAAGNDYAAFMFSNGNQKDLPGFTNALINQLGANLQRIQSLGVEKIGVTSLEPVGCLPQITASSSYKNCTTDFNSILDLHNQALHQAVEKLQSEHKQSKFVILDLHMAFSSSLKQRDSKAGEKMSGSLKPCCAGEDNGYSCGSIDKNGAKMYTLCKKPDQYFFWDNIHPSHSGWGSVYSSIRSSLSELY